MSDKKVFLNTPEEANEEGYAYVVIDFDDKAHCKNYFIKMRERFLTCAKDSAALNFEFGTIQKNGEFQEERIGNGTILLEILKRYPDLIEEAVALCGYFKELGYIIEHDQRVYGLYAVSCLSSYDKKYLPLFYEFCKKGDLDHDVGNYGSTIYSKVAELLKEGFEEEAMKLLAARHGRLRGIDRDIQYDFEQKFFRKLSEEQMHQFLKYFLLELNVSRFGELETVLQAMGYDVYYDDEDEMPLPQEMLEERLKILHKIAIEKKNDPNKAFNDKIREENLAMLPTLSQILDPDFTMPTFKKFA